MTYFKEPPTYFKEPPTAAGQAAGGSRDRRLMPMTPSEPSFEKEWDARAAMTEIRQFLKWLATRDPAASRQIPNEELKWRAKRLLTRWKEEQ